MVNPPHPGESVRECIEESGLTVTECAERIGTTRKNLSRLLNGRIGISARVARGLESLGWSNAEFWMRLQAHYDLAQERLRDGRAQHKVASVENGKTVLQKFKDAFPELYEEKVSDHTIVFRWGARIYFRKTTDGPETARIIPTSLGKFPHGNQLESYLREHRVPIAASSSHPDYLIGPEHADRVIGILKGFS